MAIEKEEVRTLDQLVLTFMEQKYEDEFSILSRDYAGFYHSFDVFVMKSHNMPQARIRVEHRENGLILDNYLGFYYLSHYQHWMQQAMEQILGHCYVSCSPSRLPTSLGLECSFLNYLSSKDSELIATVYLKNKLSRPFTQVSEKIAAYLKENKVRQGILRIYVTKDATIFEEITSGAAETGKLMEELYQTEYYLSFDEQFHIRYQEEYTFETEGE